MSTLTIVILVVIGLILLPILWNIAKGLFKFVVVALLVLGAIYIIKPEIINNLFGKENVESVVNSTKDATKEAFENVKSEIDSIKIENVKDSLAN